MPYKCHNPIIIVVVTIINVTLCIFLCQRYGYLLKDSLSTITLTLKSNPNLNPMEARCDMFAHLKIVCFMLRQSCINVSGVFCFSFLQNLNTLLLTWPHIQV